MKLIYSFLLSFITFSFIDAFQSPIYSGIKSINAKNLYNLRQIKLHGKKDKKFKNKAAAPPPTKSQKQSQSDQFDATVRKFMVGVLKELLFLIDI
jgi:hypothetical protein